MNYVENKSYVGASTDVRGRIICHKRELRKGCHSSRKLQADWDRLGRDAFSFLILSDSFPYWQSHILEGFWMDALKGVLGYNSRPADKLRNFTNGRKREGEPYSLDLPKLKSVPSFEWPKRNSL